VTGAPGPRPRRRRHHHGSLALVALALALCLASCTPSPATTPAAADADPTTADARALTTEEAQVLAAMRFRNLDAGARGVAFTLDDRGETSFEGWFDYTTGVGYGAVSRPENSLLLWNAELVATRAAPTEREAAAPLPIPGVDDLERAWAGGALEPGDSRRDSILAIIGSLGSDRPENPLLLQQSGALWLGQRTLDGVELTVFSGPVADEALPAGTTADPEAAATRYWVDAHGLAHRVDVRLGGERAWTTIRFDDAPGVQLGDPFAQAVR